MARDRRRPTHLSALNSGFGEDDDLEDITYRPRKVFKNEIYPNSSVRVLGGASRASVGWAITWAKRKVEQLSRQITTTGGIADDISQLRKSRRYHFAVSGKNVSSIELLLHNGLWSITIRAVAGETPRVFGISTFNAGVTWTRVPASERGLNRHVATADEFGVFTVSDADRSKIITNVTSREAADGEDANVTVAGPQAVIVNDFLEATTDFVTGGMTSSQSKKIDTLLENISTPRNAATQAYWQSGVFIPLIDLDNSDDIPPVPGVNEIIIAMTPEQRQPYHHADVEHMQFTPAYMATRTDTGLRSLFGFASIFTRSHQTVTIDPTMGITTANQANLFIVEVRDVDSLRGKASTRIGYSEENDVDIGHYISATVTPGEVIDLPVEGGTVPVTIPDILSDSFFIETGPFGIDESEPDEFVILNEARTFAVTGAGPDERVKFFGTVAEDGLSATGIIHYEAQYRARTSLDAWRRGLCVVRDPDQVVFHDLRTFMSSPVPATGTFVNEDGVDNVEPITTLFGQIWGASKSTWDGTTLYFAGETIWEWGYGLVYATARRSMVQTHSSLTTDDPNTTSQSYTDTEQVVGRLSFDGTNWVNELIPNDQTWELNSVVTSTSSGGFIPVSATAKVTFADGRTQTKIQAGAMSPMFDFPETIVSIANGEEKQISLEAIPGLRWSAASGTASAINVLDTQEGIILLMGFKLATATAYIATIVDGAYEEVELDPVAVPGGAGIVDTRLIGGNPFTISGGGVGTAFVGEVGSGGLADGLFAGVYDDGFIDYPAHVAKFTQTGAISATTPGLGDMLHNFSFSWPSILGGRDPVRRMGGSARGLTARKLVGNLAFPLRGLTSSIDWGIIKPAVYLLNNFANSSSETTAIGPRLGTIKWNNIEEGRDGICVVQRDLTGTNLTGILGRVWRELEAQFAAGDPTVTQGQVDIARTLFTDSYAVLYNNFASLDLIEAVYGGVNGNHNVLITKD